MKQLTDAQYHLLQQFNNLVETVEEGFDYVEASFQDYQKTESDRVLADIIDALSHLNDSKQQLTQMLEKYTVAAAHLARFEGVIDEVIKLEDCINDSNQKQKILSQNIIPAYKGWKEITQPALTKLIEQ